MSLTEEAVADLWELMWQQVNAQLNDGVTSPNGPAGTAHPRATDSAEFKI